ncbi:MAG: sensor histidine kinase [Deltaproteobacteria bacterium]|nr:sensor histidine kinase [Deltaproteobacteria bacterium]
MKFRAPASVQLRRAQMLLILAAVVPTALATFSGIIWLVVARRAMEVLFGILVLAFCSLGITGAILVSIFVRRGDSLARLQTDFVSSVSHELRTPLTSIRMFVETLMLDRVQGNPEETRRCLSLMAKETARLENLVERVIELARLEAGKRPFRMQPTRVEDIVDGALAAFDAVLLGAKVSLVREVEPGLMVNADRAAVEQALVNLLSNAYKYTGDQKVIELRVRAQGTRKIEISVADNGPGVSWDEQRLIFERFERGKAAETAGKGGTGLGLAFVSAIVRAHRGRVDVVSQPGHGARFRLLLPRVVQS